MDTQVFVSKYIVIVNFLYPSCISDAEVSCVYEESCVLPCSVPGHLLEIIWSKIPEMIPVQWHSRDQTFHQHYSYRNRTFLFCDQISQGNCSLRLTEVKPLDNGTYQCNSLTNSSRKFFFVNIKVNGKWRTGFLNPKLLWAEVVATMRKYVVNILTGINHIY